MRLGWRRGSLVVVSGLFSVALAIAVNVATGGQLPRPLAAYEALAWPAVGLLAAAGIMLALWQWRLEHTATGAGAPEAFPFVRPAELPAAPDLIGRADDLAAAQLAVAGGIRVLTLAAAPGTGKTSLALRIAHDLRDRYPDGQLFVTLRGASATPVPPEVVLSRFLGAIGRPDDERRGSPEELAARFRSAVADRRLLVVLDDAAGDDQVRPLLPGGPGCLTIVTSRRAIGDLPGALARPVAGLTPDQAYRLLAATAGPERIAADPPNAARIVAACAGLPLAVRIVGARLRQRPQWTLAALAGLLDDEAGRLDELRLGDRAVRSTFQTAYEELSELDRKVFRRAGSDPGLTFGLGAATARSGEPGVDVAEALNRLVDASLVESPRPDRYRLHDLLRLFAVETLQARESPTERAGCLVREIEWLRGQVGREERDTLLAVLRAAVDDGQAELAWSLVEAAHPVMAGVADHVDALGLWQSAEAAAVALGDRGRRSRALGHIAVCHSIAGRVAESVAAAEAALNLLDDGSAPDIELARALRRLGESRRQQGQYAGAEVALTRALELATELGQVSDEIEIRSALGVLFNLRRQPERSLPMYERAAELLPPGDSRQRAWVLTGIGVAHKLAGRREQVDRLAQEAFDIATRVDDEYLLGYCHQELAWNAEGDGRLDEAEHHFRAMLGLFEQMRNGGATGGALEGLATVARKRGRPQEALVELDAGIAIYDRLGDQVRVGELRLHRSAVLVALGRADEAKAERRTAESLIGGAEIHRMRDVEAALPSLAD